MLIPIIPHNLQRVFQTVRAICDNDSARNAPAQLPIGAHNTEDSFSWPPLPRPVASHAECISSRKWPHEPVVRCIPDPHKGAPSVPFSLKAAPLPDDLTSVPVAPHHAAVPRSRLTTAGFHCRRRGDFAWSHFFPRSVGFAPTASKAKGAFTIDPSMLCHDQAIPSISSYYAKPLRQRRTNTPWRFHSKKYRWIELALPNSFLGNAFHWHPVRRTYTIPFTHHGDTEKQSILPKQLESHIKLQKDPSKVDFSFPHSSPDRAKVQDRRFLKRLINPPGIWNIITIKHIP
jgi:hypothetical protein